VRFTATSRALVLLLENLPGLCLAQVGRGTPRSLRFVVSSSVAKKRVWLSAAQATEVSARRRIGQGPSGAQVFDVQRVLAVARVVGGVRQQVAVIADFELTDRHELLAVREGVRIQHHLLGPVAIGGLAAMDAAPLPLLRARIIQPMAQPVRHVEIGLLDAADHLLGRACCWKRLRRLPRPPPCRRSRP
jgi:hypothetical protein